MKQCGISGIVVIITIAVCFSRLLLPVRNPSVFVQEVFIRGGLLLYIQTDSVTDAGKNTKSRITLKISVSLTQFFGDRTQMTKIFHLDKIYLKKQQHWKHFL